MRWTFFALDILCRPSIFFIPSPYPVTTDQGWFSDGLERYRLLRLVGTVRIEVETVDIIRLVPTAVLIIVGTCGP
jgi:hypothetical protein